MNKYLVGMVYHEPDNYSLWMNGVIEDYESSTGIFIYADNESDAIMWGERIAEKLFVKCNPDEVSSWKSFSYDCWIENMENSSWSHAFDFFQRVNFGVMPDFDLMGTEAYKKWVDGKKYKN